MKDIKDIISRIKNTPNSILKTWAGVCEKYFDLVAKQQDHLIRANIKSMAKPTMDILTKGYTNDTNINNIQYPQLSINNDSELRDPVLQALYTSGSIDMHKSGVPIVQPSPTSLLRGICRLALPKDHLFKTINVVRKSRGDELLKRSDFEAFDKEYFQSVRMGIEKALAGNWFNIMNKAANLIYPKERLPCVKLMNSQEFYERGMLLYHLHDEEKVYIFATTSGLIIPGEFTGNDEKNQFRKTYFLKGILGSSRCQRVYQWERYRTAIQLVKEYRKNSHAITKEAYLEEARQTLSRFALFPNIEISEVQHFPQWKSWNTLSGPYIQLVSIRDDVKKGNKDKIGHGYFYDAKSLKVTKDMGRLMRTALGPALNIASIGSTLLGYGEDSLSEILSNPHLERCENDTGKIIRKYMGETLSASQIDGIVNEMFELGEKIISTEEKANNLRATQEKTKEQS